MIKIKDYVRVGSLEEAYELNQKRSACILGGMLWTKMGQRQVQTAIDLSGLGLDQIEESEEEFSIGCMVTLRQLEEHEGLNAYTDGKGCVVLGARPAKAARVELPAELAEKLAAGKASSEELKAAASEISDQFTYGSNMRGSAEYRHHLGRVLLRRCMEEIQKKEEQ